MSHKMSFICHPQRPHVHRDLTRLCSAYKKNQSHTLRKLMQGKDRMNQRPISTEATIPNRLRRCFDMSNPKVGQTWLHVECWWERWTMPPCRPSLINLVLVIISRRYTTVMLLMVMSDCWLMGASWSRRGLL